MDQAKLYKWKFYRGSDKISVENVVADIYLSYSLISYINQELSIRKAYDEEREKQMGRALHELGMDSFDIAGDQLPWLCVEEGRENYAITRNNSIIVYDISETEYSMDQPGVIDQLKKQLVPLEIKYAS